jgi:nucleotide-binding universal stress UspA family protein
MASFRSILVPVIDTQSSLDAVRVAANLVRASKGKLLVLNVVEVERSLPLDADVDDQARRAEQTLRRAVEMAEDIEGRVQTEILQSRSAGRTIVDFGQESKVEAILMGIDYRGVVGGFQLGATTQYVLTHAQCQVWVLRDTMEARR